jgi:hypothetical protein
MRPDDVGDRYVGRGVRLAVKLLREPDEGLPSILIEGDRLSLEWLSDVIRAQAAYESDCGFFVAPNGPGNIFFGKDSEFGIYIHRLPCTEKRLSAHPFRRS